MVMVEASQRTIRLIGLPSEAFGVDAVLGDSSGEDEAFQAVRPGGRSAEEDIAVGEIGDLSLQRGQFVGASRRRPEDRRWAAPRTWQRQDLQALLGGEDLQLAAEQRLAGVPL